MVRAGAMTRAEAATSELRNSLARAVGVEKQVQVDTRLALAEPGDVYLLSSDGLHGVVDDDAIAGVLRAEHDLTRAAQRLIDHALDAGGPDNVTVILVRVGDAAPVSSAQVDLVATRRRRRGAPRSCGRKGLACASERTFTAILRVRDGGAGGERRGPEGGDRRAGE